MLKVYEEGTGKSYGHLVQLQRLRAGMALDLQTDSVLTFQIFGGLLAYGIAVGSRKHGAVLEPWKIVFLVTGLLTASIGIICKQRFCMNCM
jgi:hypothetical protein